MVEPLSITTGVLSLLGVCFNVGVELKRFRDGVAVVNTTVDGLLHDVSGLEQVLESMKETFDQANNPHHSQATGHIGNHWKNLSRSLQDGQNTLIRLQELLEGVNKSVTLLDGPRRQLRFNSAAEQIVAFRQQIQSYRDALQLSLQTIILWNQLTIQESTDKILPNLDELHREIRRIALDLHLRIQNLQDAVTNTNNEDRIDAVKNLRACVHTAATIVSSASTILTANQGYQASVTNGSDFGDCFPSEPSESMLRWISSNTVCESAEDMQDKVATEMYHSGGGNPAGLGEDNIDHQSDSDSDLEIAIIKSLQKHGKEKLISKNFKAAERLFRNCLSRLSTTQTSPEDSVRRLEVMELLLETYSQQEKWEEARSILIDKLSVSGLRSHKEDHTVLSDMSTLVEILQRQGNYVEAHLYGRRVLKGYRRLGAQGAGGVEKALVMLVQICHDDGKVEEEDAYASMLSDILESKEVAVGEEGTKGTAKKAKEDKAKAIAAAEANRKVKLAAVEWMSQDSGSGASEAWPRQEGGSAVPTPRKNRPTQNKPAQQPNPITQVSHPISKDSVKAVLVQTSSAADWSSDDEPPLKDQQMTNEQEISAMPGVNKLLARLKERLEKPPQAAPPTPPKSNTQHVTSTSEQEIPASPGVNKFLARVKKKLEDQATDRRSRRGIPPPSNVLEKPSFDEHVASTNDQATDQRSWRGMPPPPNFPEKPSFGGRVASTNDQAADRRSRRVIPPPPDFPGKPSFGGRVASTNDQATDQRSQRGISPPSNVLEKPPFSEHVASTSDQATDRRSVWDLPPKSNVLEKPPFGEHVASTMLQSKPRQHMTRQQEFFAFLEKLDGQEWSK